MTRHGTQTRYKAGCDCEPCVKAHYANERARARRAARLAAVSPAAAPPVPRVAAPPEPTPPPVATPAPPVPPPPTVDTASAVGLLRSLVALGHHPRELSEDSRLDVPRLLSWQGPALAGWVIERILKLYADYHGRPGRYPNIAAAAIRKGWAPARPADPEPSPPAGQVREHGKNTTWWVDLADDEIPRPARGRWTHAERVDAAAALAARGCSDDQIGPIIGVIPRSVRRIRVDNGIPDGQPGVVHTWVPVTPDMVGQVREMAGRGCSDGQIGKELGLSERQVCRIRVKNDIQAGRYVREASRGGAVKGRQQEQAS